MSWLRQNWKLVLASLSCAVGAVAVLILWLLRKKDEADALRSKLVMNMAVAKVAGLEADKAARGIELSQNRQEAEKLDKAIVKAKKDTLAVLHAVNGMTDEEILIEFKRLGY